MTANTSGSNICDIRKMQGTVLVHSMDRYDVERIYSILSDEIFSQIQQGDTVVLKPNWVMESHKYRPDDWDYVITHPAVITGVLLKVLERLAGSGRVFIMDGPTTEASFRKLIGRYPVEKWQQLAGTSGITIEIVDLREHEWITENDIVVARTKLPGDPLGKVQFNLLDDESEFFGHRKSLRGYQGADYDRSETNRAHDGHTNLYSVSRTVVEGDVFINLAKLKTHRKSGITCCLKNLVGINTYKNYLPHHSEGGPAEGGDQFPADNVKARIEGPLVSFLKQHVLKNPVFARLLSPLNKLGKNIFGDSRWVVRSGNWYGNDTIWRMILDLNKLLLYGNADGTLRAADASSRKRYIGVVDAIRAGEGHGPLTPEPVDMGYVMCGTDPVAIDAVCAALMGFDPMKIPCIAHAFAIKNHPLCDYPYEAVCAVIDGVEFALHKLPREKIVPFEPQFGWKGHIEREPGIE